MQIAVVRRFHCSDEAVLSKFRTQQIIQVPWELMAASVHASKDGIIIELVTFHFCGRMAVVALVMRGRFLQLTLK